ncbi:MAG: nitroreductase family protein [Sphingomonadaceae bacterium]|nr:nitroreductase family protein [Sphingomonadaceae bacterium]
MAFDLEMTDELLSTTRAVRKRLDFERPVPREVINECLELAVQAPTASNSQTWRWVVVDDPDLRSKVADFYRMAMQDRSSVSEAWDGKKAEPDDQTARVLNSAGWLAENLHKVPAFVIPCFEGRPRPDAPAATLSATYGSIMPALWNFQLALRSRGLGSTLTTVHLFREKEVAELLGIPDDVLQVALLPVAYTKGTDFKRAARPPVSGITHWNGW